MGPSKRKKAEDLGVPLINENDFIDKNKLMQFIEDFKQKVGKWVFLRELKNNKRLKSV